MECSVRVTFDNKNVLCRFDLRFPLLCWSALLAIFSVIGSLRCWVIFHKLYEDDGIHGLICSNSFYVNPIGKFWGFVFCLSKAPELSKLLSKGRSTHGS